MAPVYHPVRAISTGAQRFKKRRTVVRLGEQAWGTARLMAVIHADQVGGNVLCDGRDGSWRWFKG